MSKFKIILIVLSVILVLAGSAFFLFKSLRTTAINYLSSSLMVSIKNFDAFSTFMLIKWASALKKIETGKDVSFYTFAFAGNNYSISDGTEK